MLHTLTGLARHETQVRKSRFLALAGPITSAEAASEFLQAHAHAGASHHCWAWRLGQQYRFHDDGEPGGTAGRPILQAIDGQGCDRVVVLVIRWFGGIKLGTGGLIRAYGGAAAECLRLAPKSPLRDECRVRCACPYPDIDRVQARLLAGGARIEQADYDAAGVVWHLCLPRDALPHWQALLADLTRGQGDFKVLDDA
ncbi:YigZ family protein [Castellaniella sp.]|uniref:IMPACT family protein n=1 Tax=Castellaniella sp. TaxID=1955812 RepID=UPI00355E6A57